ncbi:ABM domain-containing protein [Pseudomonas mediterranea]
MDDLGGLNMSTQIPVSHMAFVRARAGSSKSLGARLSKLIAPSRQTPGCVHFALQQSQCDADLWLMSGLWVDQQAMDAYFNSPAMGIFAELVQDLVVSSLDFHTFREVSAAQATLATVHKLAG